MRQHGYFGTLCSIYCNALYHAMRCFMDFFVPLMQILPMETHANPTALDHHLFLSQTPKLTYLSRRSMLIYHSLCATCL